MTSMTAFAAWVCIFAPLVGVGMIPIFSRVHAKAGDLTALLFPFLSAVAATRLLPHLFHPETLPLEDTVSWLEVPMKIEFGVLIDPLSIVLANVVATVSFIIVVYCVGYMKGDAHRTRFWVCMNGFIGSMLLLVLANNLLFLFIGWKLVGICSYSLIGYYYQDQRKYWLGGQTPGTFVTPSQAGLKALLVTGAGDVLMLGGILIVYFYAGTFNLLQLYEEAPTWLSAMGQNPGMVVIVSLLLLAGPMGKSAQFPFHEWLPEAMAGPGPVSALIHAATMVKSGVYFVARLLPIFYYGYWEAGISEASWFFHVTAWIGACTAFLAATQGMVALELKKVLAYSTVSQIGYMMLGLGIAGLAPGLFIDGYTSSIFHLISHALFKACLFLCAGTIIHAARSIYVLDMGAIKKHLPFTWFFTLVSSLSLMGLPPLMGFWSKDALLVSIYEASLVLFVLALITVGITAFYSVRLLGMVFHGPESTNLVRVRQAHKHLKGGSLTMHAAVSVLVLFIIIGSFYGPNFQQTLRHSFETSLAGGIVGNTLVTTTTTEESSSHTLVAILSLLLVGVGAFPAYYFYIARKAFPQSLITKYVLVNALYRFFWNRWFIDTFYDRVFVRGTTRLAALASNNFENWWDRLIHRTLPSAFRDKSERFMRHLRTETEELVYNVFYVLLLLVLLLIILLFGTKGEGW